MIFHGTGHVENACKTVVGRSCYWLFSYSPGIHSLVSEFNINLMGDTVMNQRLATKNQSHSLLSSFQPGKTAVPSTEQQAGSSKPFFRMLTSEMLTSFRGALRLSQGAPLPRRGTVRAPAQSASLLPQCPLPSTGGEPQDSHLISFTLLKEFLSSSFFYLPNPNTRSRRLCNISLEDNSGGFNSQAQPGPTPQP